MRGVTVEVLRRSVVGEDEMGEPEIEWVSESVPNVLWHQAEAERLSDGTRPSGTDDSVTLYFPKSYAKSLCMSRVVIAGRMYDVVGDPIGYMPEMTPGKHNREVTARKVAG